MYFILFKHAVEEDEEEDCYAFLFVLISKGAAKKITLEIMLFTGARFIKISNIT